MSTEQVEETLIKLLHQMPGIDQDAVKRSVEEPLAVGEYEIAIQCAAALISELENVPIALIESLVTSAELHDTKIAEYLDPKQGFRNLDKYLA